MSNFNQTETHRRLATAARLAKASSGEIGRNDSVEIGTRAVPVYSTDCPSIADATDRNDDLSEFMTINQAERLEECQRQGYVAHLYFSNRYELVDVVTVWLGTDSAEPQLIG